MEFLSEGLIATLIISGFGGLGWFIKWLLQRQERRSELKGTLRDKEIKALTLKLEMCFNEFKNDIMVMSNRLLGVEIAQDKVIKYWQIDMENKEYIDKMRKIKNLYIKEFKKGKVKQIANEMTNKFILVVKVILNNYGITVDDFHNIENDLMTGYEAMKDRVTAVIGKEQADLFYKEFDITHKQFIKDIKDTLTDNSNHYKEKFLTLCFAFLKRFMNDIQKL